MRKKPLTLSDFDPPHAKEIRAMRRKEWTMGNGQCGDCEGLSPRFLRDDDITTGLADIGHRRGCARALALEALGAGVHWKMKIRK